MRATSIPSLRNSSRSARVRGTAGGWAHVQSPFSSTVAELGDISVGDEGGVRVAYRFAMFSLSSGWLRPLISLISFAISADILEEESRGTSRGGRGCG